MHDFAEKVRFTILTCFEKISRNILQYLKNTSVRLCVGRFLIFQESLYIRASYAPKLQFEKMSGKGKAAKAKAGKKSRSTKAGLQFPVGRVHRMLRKVSKKKILFLV